MKIGVLGAGNVGGTLGRRWAQQGHEVVFGVQDPQDPKLADLLAQTEGRGRAATVAEAARFGEVVALTVPWSAVPDVLNAAGDLSGKILLDCTNPNFAAEPGGPASGHLNSGAEQIAALAPGARVVKAFNTTGWENMADPRYGSEVVTMLYAGDDPQAKSAVAQLAADLGFDAVDAGPLSFAHHLEALAQLWGQLAYGQKLGRNIAFRLLRR
ncbi:MAG TPA: NADPH-dependent F420 reductase [Chthonomonadaceae bacterium]|nr:NADPH-dependent F420 reductase [Chthonomonadaceae bacterium]